MTFRLLGMALALGLGACSRAPQPVEAARPGSPTPAAAPVEAPVVVAATPRPVFAPLESSEVAQPGETFAVASTQGAMLPWEAAVASILQSSTTPAAKSEAVLRLLPQVPEEALAGATEQAVASLPDRDFRRVAGPLLLNPGTHGAVQSVLFADLMKRPDPVTLPLLLAIAKTPEHPFAPSALDNLELLAPPSQGQNWPAWERVINKKLADTTEH